MQFEAGSVRARDALSGFSETQELIGFTKGQFSFVEILDVLLDFTGPADLTVSTWTAAAGDASFLGSWAAQDRIKRSRWIVDYSFPSRRGGEQALRAIIGRFGPDSVRITRTHAKFALLRGVARSVACLTSMNLNQNPRFEYFHCTCDARLIEGLSDMVDEIWSTPSAAEQLDWRPQYHKDAFDEFRRPEDAWANLRTLADVA